MTVAVNPATVTRTGLAWPDCQAAVSVSSLRGALTRQIYLRFALITLETALTTSSRSSTVIAGERGNDTVRSEMCSAAG